MTELKNNQPKKLENNTELNTNNSPEVSFKNATSSLGVEDLKQNIHEILDTLSNFKTNKPKLPRKHFIEKLGENASELYGYSLELIEIFLRLFSPEECVQFLEANDRPRPVTIRSNPLKIKRRELAKFLIEKGVNLDPIGEWTNLGLKVTESQVPLGATPEYMAGFYMLQSASSLVPVIALAPKENERIADLCAAPGGKTTHIASLMKNGGSIVANDSNKQRIKALMANIHRMGVTNCTITNYDGRKFGNHFGKFDRVLLDAPCTGSGVISRDESIRTKKGEEDIKKCTHTQKELILEAIDMLEWRKNAGVLVYSTCSVFVEENEEVIDYAISKRNVKLVDLGVGFGTEGFTKFRQKRFHPQMKLTRRFYPHVHNMDGFFVAKLVKLGDFKEKKKHEEMETKPPKNEPNKKPKTNPPVKKKQKTL